MSVVSQLSMFINQSAEVIFSFPKQQWHLARERLIRVYYCLPYQQYSPVTTTYKQTLCLHFILLYLSVFSENCVLIPGSSFVTHLSPWSLWHGQIQTCCEREQWHRNAVAIKSGDTVHELYQWC